MTIRPPPVPSLLLCLLLAAPAWGQIQRCVDKQGNPVFTDQSCAAVGARAMTAAQRAQADAPLPPPMPSATSLCAADVDELRQSLEDAFASHQGDHIADLTWWQGHGRGAAIAELRNLGRLLQQPLLELRLEPSGDAGASGTLVARTPSESADGAPRETRFAIRRHAGCLWFSPAG